MPSQSFLPAGTTASRVSRPTTALSGGQSVRTPSAAANLRSLNDFARRAQQRIGLEGQVNLLLSDDATLRQLNREYRGKNSPTDVLSFPAIQLDGVPQPIAGDLAISIDTARRQAKTHRHTLQLELKILILHGLLHLAGFDHETDSGEMRERESELRAHFRLPVSLIERSSK